MLGKLVGTTAFFMFCAMCLADQMPAVEQTPQISQFIVKEEPAVVPFSQPMIVLDDGTLVAELAPTVVDTAPSDTPDSQALPVKWVFADRVNVRGGPSTSYGVLDQVQYADAVTVVADAGNGWTKIRIEGDGVEGFMASRFLQEEQPG